MWWRNGKIKLRPWLIISSLTQVLLSVGIVGYISYRSGEGTVSRFAEELMVQGGDRIVSKIDHYLTIPDLINRLNEDAIRTEILDPQDFEGIHRHLILQKRQFTTVTSIVYGDPAGNFRTVNNPSPSGRDGEEYAKANPIEIGIADPSDPDEFRVYNVNELGIKDQYLSTLSLDVRERPWYKEAVQAQQPGWCQPFEVGETAILAINAYRPIYSEDKHDLIGVFAVNISLEQIGTFLREIPISKSADIYIVDEYNRLIASSDPNLPYNVDIFEDGNYQVKTINPTENPNLTIKEVHNFLQSQFPHLAEINSTQKLKLTIDGERHFIRVIPYGSELGLDWLMVMIVPESDLTEENQANLHKTIILCFVAGAIALLNSLVTSRWIVIPILRLQQLALKLPQKKDNQDFLNSPIQEINNLGLILEQMAQEIQTTFTQLADSESKLRQILEYLPIGVVVLDSNSNIFYINAYGMKLLGINSILEAKPGEHSQVYQLFRAGTDDLYPFAELPSIRALQGEFVFIDDLEIHLDGKIIPCAVSSNPIFNHKQEIIGCVNVSQDISDRLSAQEILTNYNQNLEKQINEATETLRKNQTILQRVLEKVPGNICAWVSYPDGHLEYQYINPLLDQILEVDLQTLIDHPEIMFEMIHPADQSHYQQAISHSTATLELFDEEWRILPSSNQIKWLQGILQPELGENGAIYWYGVILDITNRKKAEAKLKESEERFRSCFHNVATGMVLTDMQGRFIQVNQAFCEIIGYSAAELSEMTFLQITHPDDVKKSRENKLKLESGEIDSFQIEKRYLHRQGKIIYALTNVSIVRNLDNLPLYFIAQIQDNSDRYYAQLELEKAKKAAEEANLAKTRFIASMSHELRTPLNAILGFTQLLIQSTQGESRSQLQGILDNGNHLLSLINNLLTAAQIETGKLNINLTQVNLPELLAQLHNSFALQAKVKGLQLVWCNETDLPYYLETDAVKLRQILINILDNALKFTHQGKITFTASQNNNFLIFTIEDTGEGIAPEEITQLFQPFTQTTTGQKSLQGTGLGLSVTEQLIKQLGGEITVNSQEGRGTIFRVVLPLQNISTEVIEKSCLTIDNPTFIPTEETIQELSTLWLRKFHQSILEGDLSLMLGLVNEVREQNDALADYLGNLVTSFQLREVLSLISKYDQPG